MFWLPTESSHINTWHYWGRGEQESRSNLLIVSPLPAITQQRLHLSGCHWVQRRQTPLPPPRMIVFIVLLQSTSPPPPPTPVTLKLIWGMIIPLTLNGTDSATYLLDTLIHRQMSSLPLKFCAVSYIHSNSDKPQTYTKSEMSGQVTPAPASIVTRTVIV